MTPKAQEKKVKRDNWITSKLKMPIYQNTDSRE